MQVGFVYKYIVELRCLFGGEDMVFKDLLLELFEMNEICFDD